MLVAEPAAPQPASPDTAATPASAKRKRKSRVYSFAPSTAKRSKGKAADKEAADKDGNRRTESKQSMAPPKAKALSRPSWAQLPPKQKDDDYEVSDFEEDAEGNRKDCDRTRKHVPSWCTLFVQMVTEQAEIDPDSICVGVPECDLDVIFPDRLYLGRKPAASKRRRGSSGRWNEDGLTKREAVAYATRMGQTRRWSQLMAR